MGDLFVSIYMKGTPSPHVISGCDRVDNGHIILNGKNKGKEITKRSDTVPTKTVEYYAHCFY